MTTVCHVADRCRLRGRALLLLLLAVASFSLLLYVSGAMALLGDIAGLAGRAGPGLRTVSGLSAFCRALRLLAADRLPQVIGLIAAVYLALQVLCVPGTVVLNAATGAVIGTGAGVVFCTLLGTAGALGCYALSAAVGVALVERVDRKLMEGKGLAKMRRQVNRYRSDLFVYLIFLRLTPILPNWLINLASPMVGVPVHIFAAATFIGIAPQTYLVVRFGALANVSSDSKGSIVSVWDTLLLAVLGVTIVLFFYLKKKFTEKNTQPPYPHYKVLV